jgi:threonine dehydrogenase-like Zn-dependent dehydrogenase
MKAVTWQGRRKVTVEEVADPVLREPTDAVIRVTSTGLCGSDLHLYEPLSAFMTPGDIIGHEPMGYVEEVGGNVTNLAPGDRVVVPFNISCGRCWMCERGLQSQCETTQNHEHGTGASLFGYSKLYGQVPGGQAEYLRVPHADYGPIKVPEGPPDDRFLYLSDVLPTAWQAVQYADVPRDGTVLVLGLGPIGAMCCRIAHNLGHQVIGVDLVPERIERVRELCVEVIDLKRLDEAGTTVGEAARTLTSGRGPDSVIDAVGLEAHGSPATRLLHKATSFLPSAVADPLMRHAGMDRLAALHTAFDAVRRGGTVSVVGVYGGSLDPMPMMQLFDKQVQIRMGQANVRRWSDDILDVLLQDEDVLGTEDLASHHLPLSEAPSAYDRFQRKQDEMVKVVFRP